MNGCPLLIGFGLFSKGKYESCEIPERRVILEGVVHDWQKFASQGGVRLAYATARPDT